MSVRILREPARGWFVVRATCPCGCGYLARIASGATLAAAVWRFRFSRREAVALGD